METKYNYSSFDIYSKRIGFYYNDHEKIGSIFGMFLTFVYIMASLILFTFQIIRTIKRTELKVYDSTQFSREIPSIEINSDHLYFAFGIEDPSTSSRFIDESIYYPKIVFVSKIKINDQLVTKESVTLEHERCDSKKFGDNYQNLFLKNELNNSYCLKDTNFNFSLTGGYKYNQMTYLRIRIYPCQNTTKNNNSCKPQDVIDQYLSSGYFSIILKDIGFSPMNFSFPIEPTLQDLFTTIDKSMMRNYILKFQISEIHTDIGLINEDIKKEKYLQYSREMQTLTFRDEEEYYSGKSIILVQMKLDDTIFIQTRAYTKISEIFSRIGGYMQLMNTAFMLLSLMINKINSNLKIINSIFKFDLKENKILIKFHALNDPNLDIHTKKNNLVFSPKNLNQKIKKLDKENKSNNILLLQDNGQNYSSVFNIPSNKKKSESKKIEININNNYIPFDNSKDYSINSKNNYKQIVENTIYYNEENLNHNINLKDIEKNEKDSRKNQNEYCNINFFDYFFCRKEYNNKKLIEFFNLAKSYFRKKMDIVHVFSLLSFIEKNFSKKNV